MNNASHESSFMKKFYFAAIKEKESTAVSSKLKKNGYHPQVIYMANQQSREQFLQLVEPGDLIELHGDGLPWVYGGKYVSPEFDHNPYTLAAYFDQLLPNKNIALTIDLRFCTSGVTAKGPKGDLCFAEDFSVALKDYHFTNITVIGYTGYINAQNPFKQSLSEAGDESIHGAKVKHCKLAEGSITYCDGKVQVPAQKVLADNYTYTPKEYKNDLALQKYFKDKQNHLLKLPSLAVAIPKEISGVSPVEEVFEATPGQSVLFSSFGESFRKPAAAKSDVPLAEKEIENTAPNTSTRSDRGYSL